jgi:hypothetical protein
MADNSTTPLDSTVTVDCSSANGYTNDNLGIRISSIFVILFGSLVGMYADDDALRCALSLSDSLQVPSHPST